MNLSSALPKFVVTLAACTLFGAVPSFSRAAADQAPAHAAGGTLAPVGVNTDPAWLAQARAAYALDRCPVCGDKLDEKSPDYIYQRAGKSDRLVRFCGDDDCVPNFKKDPDKYLKLIDDAAAAKAAAAKK
jgi:YHS domain-containing protein